MAGKWYSNSIRQIEIELRTDLSRGLDRREVRARRRKYGENDIFVLPRQSYLSYLVHLVTDIPTLLLFLTILIAIIFEERITLLSVLGIVLVYVIAAVTSYVRSQRVLDGMSYRALPAAKVLREGKLYLIKQKQLVRGDVIYLSGGDIVPCDARLIESEDLEVLETNLTSVTRTVSKDASFTGYGDLSPTAQKNMVFASTILTAGKAKAVVCEVGANTLVCKMEKNKPIVKHENLPLLTTLKKVSRIWSILMMLLLFFMTSFHLLFAQTSGRLLDTFLSALSLAVSSMSEYYMPFGFLIVSCGIYAAVKKYGDVSAGAMIKDVGKLDALRKIDCLLLPSEGVFTTREQKLEAVFSQGTLFEKNREPYSEAAIRTVRLALLSTGLYGAAVLTENNLKGNNVYSPEEEAIIHEAEDLGIYNSDLEWESPLLEHRGIGAMNDIETTIIRGSNHQNLVAVRGGVQEILERCTTYCKDGRLIPLDAVSRGELMIAASTMAKHSFRVVAVASGTTEYEKVFRPASIQRNLVFEGFLGICEPILPSVAMRIRKCREEGIAVLMMTEDENENRISFAKALGIIEGEEQCVTGTQINRMKDGIFCINVERYRLYCGLNVAQKRLLLKTLKEQGKIVGVLAQSLEEIILYREADIGFSQSVTIAQGGSRLGVDMTSRKIPVFNRGSKNRVGECEALKFVSDVIVSEASVNGEGGFHAILQALHAARGIFSNLHRAVRYLMTTQIARILIVLWALVTETPLLSPAQILYTGLFVDFSAILMIAFTRPTESGLASQEKRAQGERSAHRLLLSHAFSLLLGGLWAVLALSLPRIMPLFALTLTQAQISTMLFYSFIACQWMVFLCSAQHGGFSLRHIRINRITLLAFFAQACVIGACVGFPQIGAWLDCVAFPTLGWLMVAAIPLILLIAFLVDSLLMKQEKNDEREQE